MLQQREKFDAIKRAFPKIPSRDMSRIASATINLDNVPALVFHFVMHQYTKYDSLLHGRTNPYEARQLVQPEVYSILNSWR